MKTGRNDPCHCGSGQKYKKCCEAKDEAARVAQLAAEQAALVDTLDPEEAKRSEQQDGEKARREGFHSSRSNPQASGARPSHIRKRTV